MRAIKFRAWDSHNKVMITPYAELIGGRFWGEDLTNTGYAEPLPEHVMQFSGLLDKNGKEIYEGDIVKDSFGNEYKVVYNEFCAFMLYSNDVDFMAIYPNIIIEVIGNIHEGIK